ncbi:FUSC family protein [Streptomyces erythrochromogenes]|uniref:FUSC family protein n=1 Tax=Streptomyces erythrochromogenes TaxID=285574 RepID=UPI0036960669
MTKTTTVTALVSRAWHSLRGIKEIYLSRDASARYDWHLALGTALIVGAPVLGGAITGHTQAAVLIAIAAWFTALAVPKKSLPARIGQLLTRTALLLAATGIGMLVAGKLWATVLASIVLALIVPLPGVAVTPLIAMIMGIAPQPGIGPAEHVGLFLAGSLWTTAILLIPYFGGPYTAHPPGRPRGPLPERIRQAWTGLRSAIAEGHPKVRYAVRVAVCFTVAYAVMTFLDVPHANWALVGILTTLRPSWDETRGRIVKRLVGMFLGCLMIALLLGLTPGSPLAEALAITICGGIARPMRGFNYGFWPIFGTPVLLLLADFNARLGLIDVVERLTNNMLGALLVALTMLLLWPAHEESGIPGLLVDLLDIHGRFLERVATVVEFGPPLEREHRIRKAEAADRALRNATGRLATQRSPSPQLLTALDRTLTAASHLRERIVTHRPYETATELDTRELLTLARQLRDTAPTVEGEDLETGPEPACWTSAIAEAAHQLAQNSREATEAARIDAQTHHAANVVP